jgi:hypothetical protein
MAIPYRNGVSTIVAVCKTIVKMAALYSQIWGSFLTPTDKALLDDLVSCANAVIGALERTEYRP